MCLQNGARASDLIESSGSEKVKFEGRQAIQGKNAHHKRTKRVQRRKLSCRDNLAKNLD